MSYTPYAPTTRQVVTLCDLFDPTNKLRGLLNPTSLPLSIDVEIGRLYPVGWSHPTLQYGHTKEVQIPLELYFSAQLLRRFDKHLGSLDVTTYVHWLTSFCYGRTEGEAPHPLIIIWPNTLYMAVVITHLEAEYLRFYADDLRPSAVRVSLETIEYRQSFRSSQDFRGTHGGSGDGKIGFNQPDPAFDRSGGPRMKLGK